MYYLFAVVDDDDIQAILGYVPENIAEILEKIDLREYVLAKIAEIGSLKSELEVNNELALS